MELAPVYDCGSCLYPQADEMIKNSALTNADEMLYRIYEIPTSAIMFNGKKIKYYDFISSLQNQNCCFALQRIVPRINMPQIIQIIENTPFISNLQKKFYTTVLLKRKELILDCALKKITG